MPNLTYQWQREDGNIAGASGSAFVPSPGSLKESYTPVAGDTGHTIRLTASDGVNSYVGPWSPAVAASGGFTYNAAVAALTRPAFSHTGRTLIVDGALGGTIGQVQNYISGAGATMVAGDQLTVRNLTIPITTSGFLFRVQKQLGGYAQVIWDGIQFTGPTVQSSTNPWSLFYFGPSPEGWYFDFINGSNFTNPISNGQFITSHGMNNCVLDHMYQHDVAGPGGGFNPASDGSDIHDCFINSEIHRFCKVATFDPHPENGTGVHGILVSDADPYTFHHNTISIWATDADPYGGSAIETGTPNDSNAPHDNNYYVRAERLRMKATSQVAGNAVNLWGTPAVHGEVFHIVEALDCAGRAIDTNGYRYQSNLAAGAVRVVYGRADGCAYAPSDGYVGQPWDPRHNVTYEDVATNTGVLS